MNWLSPLQATINRTVELRVKRERMREYYRKYKKPVHVDGKVYANVADASFSTGLSRDTIYARIHRKSGCFYL